VALTSLSLRGFRNLETVSLEFEPGQNYVFGPNGAGKTNLLEAIHYLAIGRSFRRCPDAELLGFGKDVLIVSGTDESGATAEIRFDGREKRILRNNIPVDKLSEYLGWLPVVVLLLDDIELVRGAPGFRRGFMDMAVAKAGRSGTDFYHQDTKTQRSGQEQAGQQAKAEARSQKLDGRSGGEEQQGKSEAKSQEPKAKSEGEEQATSEARSQKLDGRSEGEEQQEKSEAKSQEPRAKSEERSYIALMSEYRRAVGQYNRLLERGTRDEGRGTGDEVAAWEEEIVRTGVPVHERRMKLAGPLLEAAGRYFERLAGEPAVFSYRSSIASDGTNTKSATVGKLGSAPNYESQDLAGAFRQRLSETRARARYVGHVLVGPHRDDVRIRRGENDLRRFGSVGEQRLAGIALRLAEADMLLSAGRQRPVFLLDEIASELDERRSRLVLDMVAERGQMIYAAARRMARLEVKGQSAKGKMQNGGEEGLGEQGFEGSGAEDSVRDRSAPQNPWPPEPPNPFRGKEFHVEAGTVRQVS
jgi:recombinational DNA repair ATPase RecF